MPQEGAQNPAPFQNHGISQDTHWVSRCSLCSSCPLHSHLGGAWEQGPLCGPEVSGLALALPRFPLPGPTFRERMEPSASLMMWVPSRPRCLRNRTQWARDMSRSTTLTLLSMVTRRSQFITAGASDAVRMSCAEDGRDCDVAKAARCLVAPDHGAWGGGPANQQGLECVSTEHMVRALETVSGQPMVAPPEVQEMGLFI